jgi:hypothetical protein
MRLVKEDYRFLLTGSVWGIAQALALVYGISQIEAYVGGTTVALYLLFPFYTLFIISTSFVAGYALADLRYAVFGVLLSQFIAVIGLLALSILLPPSITGLTSSIPSLPYHSPNAYSPFLSWP